MWKEKESFTALLGSKIVQINNTSKESEDSPVYFLHRGPWLCFALFCSVFGLVFKYNSLDDLTVYSKMYFHIFSKVIYNPRQLFSNSCIFCYKFMKIIVSRFTTKLIYLFLDT